MADSLSGLPKRSKDKQARKGLPTRVTRSGSGTKVDKYSRYRNKIGKPRGPGVPGNKSGRNAI